MAAQTSNLIKSPTNLMQQGENLYLYCSLTAVNSLGQPVDFTGLQTYSIGFLKEGAGFGITDINVEMSPSLQPLIEITFKDFYGNLTFNNNAAGIDTTNPQNIWVNQLAQNNNVTPGSLNFATIFDLPYPKFTLVMKGYIGDPVQFELNVMKTNVTLVPTDGSYEIKATFIPNLYGFYAELPYFYLQAVNALKPPGDTYPSPQYLATVGASVNEAIQTVDSQYSKIETQINLFLNGSTDIAAMLEVAKSGIIYSAPNNTTATNSSSFQGATTFTDLHFNLTFSGVPIKSISTAHQSILISKTNVDDIRNIMIASINRNSSILLDLNNSIINLPSADISRSTLLLTNNLQAITAMKQAAFGSDKTLQQKIGQVTISNVFKTLIKSSAYLMGRILGAGYAGYLFSKSDQSPADRDKTSSPLNRDKTSSPLIGKYFPLKAGNSSNSNTTTIAYSEVPASTTEAPVEWKFINDFISALAIGVSNQTSSDSTQQNFNATNPLNLQQNPLAKRMNNVEILRTNPYTDNNPNTIISNMLIRSGLAIYMLNQSDPIDIPKFVSAETLNLNYALQTINSTNREILTTFCNSIKNAFNADGTIIPTRTGTVALITNTSFNSYLTSVGINNYTASTLYYNGCSYIGDNSNDYYMFIQDEQNKLQTLSESGDITSSINSNDITRPVNSGKFDITLLNDISTETLETDETFESLIQSGQVLRYNGGIDQNISSLTSALIASNEILNIENEITATTGQKYYCVKYRTQISDPTSNGNLVWNLFGTDDLSRNQRNFLRQLCGQVLNAMSEIKKIKDAQAAIALNNLSIEHDTFYIQFHHLCNSWQNLLRYAICDNNKPTNEQINKIPLNIGEANTLDLANKLSSDMGTKLEKVYTDALRATPGTGGYLIDFQIPLQQIQNEDNGLNPGDAIINTEPLTSDNSDSTVFNVMSNICNKNNFLLLSIPGNINANLDNLLQPNISTINSSSMIANNTFYIIFMPTPENRVAYNNGTVFNNIDYKLALNKGKYFKIDFGSPDNNIVKSINMTTEDNKMTSESAIAQQAIADPQNLARKKGYDCSVLSVMEGRSYKINGEMIGNAQLCPTQFFIIDTIPIFNGLYYIMKVVHHMSSPNNMTTRFEAIRMKYTNGKFIYVSPYTIGSLLPQPLKDLSTFIPNNAPTFNSINGEDLPGYVGGYKVLPGRFNVTPQQQ